MSDRCTAIVRGRRCRVTVMRDGFCRIHHPEAHAKRVGAFVEARRREYRAIRAETIGLAVMERFTDRERAALPQWFRREYGFGDTGVPIHPHDCQCYNCETFAQMMREEYARHG